MPENEDLSTDGDGKGEAFACCSVRHCYHRGIGQRIKRSPFHDNVWRGVHRFVDEQHFAGVQQRGMMVVTTRSSDLLDGAKSCLGPGQGQPGSEDLRRHLLARPPGGDQSMRGIEKRPASEGDRAGFGANGRLWAPGQLAPKHGIDRLSQIDERAALPAPVVQVATEKVFDQGRRGHEQPPLALVGDGLVGDGDVAWWAMVARA